MGYLLADLIDDWVVVGLPIYRNIIICLIALFAIVLILSVLLQTSNQSSGASALTGVTESYYSQNKSNTRDGRLKRWTVICGIAILVLIVLFYIPNLFVNI